MITPRSREVVQNGDTSMITHGDPSRTGEWALRGRAVCTPDGIRPAAVLVRDERIPVVVCAAEGRRVGLVVGRILDIVEETVAAQSRASP